MQIITSYNSHMLWFFFYIAYVSFITKTPPSASTTNGVNSRGSMGWKAFKFVERTFKVK